MARSTLGSPINQLRKSPFSSKVRCCPTFHMVPRYRAWASSDYLRDAFRWQFSETVVSQDGLQDLQSSDQPWPWS